MGQVSRPTAHTTEGQEGLVGRIVGVTLPVAPEGFVCGKKIAARIDLESGHQVYLWTTFKAVMDLLTRRGEEVFFVGYADPAEANRFVAEGCYPFGSTIVAC